MKPPPSGRRPPSRSPRPVHVLLALGCAVLFGIALSCGGGGGGDGTASGGEGSGLTPTDGVPEGRPERLSLLLERIGNGVIVRGYAGMAQSFRDLEAATTSFCTQPSGDGLEALRGAWREAMAAWLATSAIQFGPIRDDNRRLRIEFWPDTNNNVRRAVQQLVARDDVLDAEILSRQSVAAQGLPALEQLLFAEQDALAAFTTGERAVRRCTYAIAIAGNLRGIGEEVESGWRTTQGGFVDQLVDAGRGSDVFATRDAAIEELVNSLVTVVEVTANSRIGDPLGEDLADAKPFRAESFPSGNSLANVVSVVRGMAEIYSSHGDDFGFDDYLYAAERIQLNREIRDGFETVIELAEAIPVPLAVAVEDQALRPAVEELYAQATTLARLLKNQLSAVMQVRIGFNENDGD